MIYETLDNGVGSAGAQGEEAAEEAIVAEAHQPVALDQRTRQLAKQTMKRLHPG
jgi:hypothetical protein